MSEEFDSRKDLESTKFGQRPQIFVKLSFREFQNYLVYVLLIIWPYFIKFKLVKNRKVSCEFMRKQSLK